LVFLWSLKLGVWSFFSQQAPLRRSVTFLLIHLMPQRLAFGAGQDAADAFGASLTRAAGVSPAAEVRALLAETREAVTRIQLLQARHIAERDDKAMAGIEEQIESLHRQVSRMLDRLRSTLPRERADALTSAGASFQTFMAVNSEVLDLSRRNTNVKSLELTFERKRVIAAACEDQLVALERSLSEHGTEATR
jgi:hypothetical protein